MSEHAAVLFANEAFYLAFRQRDAAAMDALWAAEHPVACVHPGWQALIGRAAVIESWRAILGNAKAPAVTCREAEAFVQGAGAFVVCYEVIGRTVLVATNVFVREGRTWKLVHHQAGPCPLDPEALEAESEQEPVQ